MKNENLKPVIMDNIPSKGSYYQDNQYAQNLLLKALSDGITDPNELRKIAGLRTVTEVYRTLDKMKIRKGYHVALEEAGMDLNFIVGKLKNLCGDDMSPKIQLGAVQTVLKSLGLEKYEKNEEAGKSWEELVLEVLDKKDSGEIIEDIDVGDYEVKTPILPEEVKKRQREEKQAASELYE